MKKLISLVATFALFASTLVACSQTTPAESKPAETTASTVATETVEQKLTVWAWDPNFNLAALKEAEAVYQKTHPNFKLDIVEMKFQDIQMKIATAVEAGDLSSLPDIFLSQDHSIQNYATRYPAAYADLTNSGIDFSKFTKGKLADSTVGGKNLGVPFDNGAVVVGIRTDILEQAGYKAEDFNNITWSKFIEQARVVKEKTGLPTLTFSGAGEEFLLPVLQSAGASPITKDGKVNLAENKALKAGLETLKTLVTEGLIQLHNDWDQYIASFSTGKVAGVMQGCWIMSSIQASADQSGKWALVNVPSLDGVEGATNYTNFGGSSWSVSAGSKNVDLAVDFLKSTFGSDVAFYDTLLEKVGAIASYVPAGESALYQKPVEFYAGQKVFADIVNFASKVPEYSTGTYFSEIKSAIIDAATNVLQNGASIEDELKKAQETVEFKIQG